MKLNATKVDSRNVMLVTDFTQSFTGFPLTIAELHQVFDNSSPVPIPTGAPIPTTPPELQETDQPIVTVTPPALPFSLSAFANSGQPAALPLTFILKSQHPKRWLLTMLSPTPPPSTDITNGVAPSILVTPSGGEWSDPVLSVVVTLQGVYLATLEPNNTYYIVPTGS